MDRRTFSRLVPLGAASLAVQPVSRVAADPPRISPRPGVPEATLEPVGNETSAAAVPVSTAEYERLAHDALPRATYEYISTGSADEFTLRENTAAFQRIKLLPPLLRGVSVPDTSTTVLSQKISFPVLLAPVAGQRLYHPDGGLAAARAAALAGTIYGMSSSVGHSVEEIGAAGSGPKWFQLYVPKDRGVARALIERVNQSGFQAIVLTVDLGEWKDADRRNRFALPREMLLRHLQDIGFPEVSDRMTDTELTQFNLNCWDLALNWEFFDWLRTVTKLPLLIKGVLRADDARRAVAMGLDGIVVSNHGGRRLDGMPSSIEMLPEVADAVGGKVDILLDSGVRRGTDVLKAIALGARAVLIGRPYVWALSAGGEPAVSHVIQLLRDEFTNAMIACGCQTVAEIQPSLLR